MQIESEASSAKSVRPRSLKPRRALLLPYALGFCVLALAPLSALAAKPALIRFGVSSAGVGNPPRTTGGWTSVAQMHRHLEREFEADGIPVKWIFFKGQGPAVNEAIANNQLDFTSLGDLPSIVGRSAGALPESLYRREYKDISLSARLSPVFDNFIMAVDRRRSAYCCNTPGKGISASWRT